MSTGSVAVLVLASYGSTPTLLRPWGEQRKMLVFATLRSAGPLCPYPLYLGHTVPRHSGGLGNALARRA